MYSLGVLLFETLTGRPPYPADTWEDLSRALENPMIPRVTGVLGLPDVVADLCFRCLSRDPLRRPTAHQVGVTLREQLSLSDTPTPTPVPPTPQGAAEPPTPTVEPTPPRRSRTRVAAYAITGVSVLAVAVLLGVLLGRPDHGPKWTPPMGGPMTKSAMPMETATGMAMGIPSSMPTTTSPSPQIRGAIPPSLVPGITIDETPSQSPSPTATSPTPQSLAAGLQTVDDLIVAGTQDGSISKDTGQDLLNLVRNLQTSVTNGSTNVAERVENIRQKVARRVLEGSIEPEYGDTLDAALAELNTAS
jgi:serine/threonine-protein kinase